MSGDYKADPTDNLAPYGTKEYTRTEFGFVSGTRANTHPRLFKAGRSTKLVFKAKKDKDALKCFHIYLTCCSPCTAACCHTKALTKRTFTHVFEDRIESNLPISCCCWIGDNTRVYYLDRDFAQNWSKAGLCTPCFTHCSVGGGNKFGEVAIGHGSVNFVMNSGARRIAPPLVRSCGCAPTCQGGPFFGECCTFLPCSYDWVCFPFIKDAGDFAKKVQEVRDKLVQEYNIVPGKPVEAAPAPTDDEMSRA